MWSASTRALTEHGEAYVEALNALQATVAEHSERHGGAVVNTEGDGTFLAFPSARSALDALTALLDDIDRTASRAASRPCGCEPAPTPATATPIGDDYFSLPVHVAARVSATAGAGQTFVSQAVHRRARPPDRRAARHLRPQGHRRARHAVARRGRQRPAARHADRAAPTSPRPRTSFVGRDAELDELTVALEQPGLVTVAGPGGLGKTAARERARPPPGRRPPRGRMAGRAGARADRRRRARSRRRGARDGGSRRRGGPGRRAGPPWARAPRARQLRARGRRLRRPRRRPPRRLPRAAAALHQPRAARRRRRASAAAGPPRHRRRGRVRRGPLPEPGRRGGRGAGTRGPRRGERGVPAPRRASSRPRAGGRSHRQPAHRRSRRRAGGRRHRAGAPRWRGAAAEPRRARRVERAAPRRRRAHRAARPVGVPGSLQRRHGRRGAARGARRPRRRDP